MVSVIIPAYNSENTLKECLESLVSQDCTEEYEIIVVDDGSTDSTPRIVSKFKKARLVCQENAGPASARNRGAREAKGDIIIFTDADCVPFPNWITETLKPFKENNDVIGVKGRYKTQQKEIIAKFVQLEYEDKYKYMLKNKYIDFMDTYSAAFKKDIFIEMKGYDSEFPVACAEDVELSYRLANKGYKMVFNPDALVFHLHPSRLRSYLRKKYKFAYWRMLAFKKNPDKAIKDSHTPQMMKLQLLFPPAILGSTILTFIFSSLMYLSLLLLVLFILTTIPFTFRAFRNALILGLFTPAFLFLRATAQVIGISAGIINILKTQ